MDRRIHLKVKIKSLAAEARIIRKEERKLQDRAKRINHPHGNPDRAEKMHWRINSLALHRTGGVRWEARHTLLAYAIFRNKPYNKIEQKVAEGNRPDFKKVTEMAIRFGCSREQVLEWIDDAKKYLGIYVAPIGPEPVKYPVKTGVTSKLKALWS